MKFPIIKIDSNRFFLTTGPHEAATNTITYKKGNYKKKIYGNGMSPNYGYFYITSKMILEVAGFKINDLNR